LCCYHKPPSQPGTGSCRVVEGALVGAGWASASNPASESSRRLKSVPRCVPALQCHHCGPAGFRRNLPQLHPSRTAASSISSSGQISKSEALYQPEPVLAAVPAAQSLRQMKVESLQGLLSLSPEPDCERASPSRTWKSVRNLKLPGAKQGLGNTVLRSVCYAEELFLRSGPRASETGFQFASRYLRTSVSDFDSEARVDIYCLARAEYNSSREQL
jgi:hypothetical protein